MPLKEDLASVDAVLVDDGTVVGSEVPSRGLVDGERGHDPVRPLLLRYLVAVLWWRARRRAVRGETKRRIDCG